MAVVFCMSSKLTGTLGGGDRAHGTVSSRSCSLAARLPLPLCSMVGDTHSRPTVRRPAGRWVT